MKKRIIVFLSVALLLTTLRVYTYFALKPPVKLGNTSFVTRLSTQPKVYNSYQSFSVNLLGGEPVFVKTDSDLILNYGNQVKVSGSLDYKLLTKGGYYFINKAQMSLDNKSQNPILAVINTIRQQISQTFYEYLPNDLAGLLLGIVIGVKANFSPQFLNSLKLSGVMHVIAASGMNVTMVGCFFFYTFLLFLRRRISIVLTIAIIISYSFLAGFQPSIIRACIMASILFFSQLWGRQNYSLYSLILTLFIMLFVWPQFLVDVGFQLSFVSTLGLLFLPQTFGKIRSFVSEDLVITLSAQLASPPILLINFDTFPIALVAGYYLLLLSFLIFKFIRKFN